jgi:hypothetical protein
MISLSTHFFSYWSIPLNPIFSNSLFIWSSVPDPTRFIRIGLHGSGFVILSYGSGFGSRSLLFYQRFEKIGGKSFLFNVYFQLIVKRKESNLLSF